MLHPTGVSVPPGQGQVLIGLRGEATVEESADDDAKVVHTDRSDRRGTLGPGGMWLVANDARWTLGGDPEAVVLCVSTSVPRQLERARDLLAIARRRPHMAPRQVYANEMVRLELVASRGRLPFRGWVPYDHTSPKVEYAVILQGGFLARAGSFEGELAAGSLLRIPAGTAHNFRAAGKGLNVGLVISALVERKEVGEPLDRDDVQGFTPFRR